MFKKSLILFAALFLFFLFSCNKEVQKNETFSNTTAGATSNIENSSLLKLTANAQSHYSSIKEIIKAFAKNPVTESLQSLNSTPTPQSDSVNLVNMNIAVANYLQKYPSVGYINPSYIRDPNFVMVTIVYAYLEESGRLGNSNMASNIVPLWLDCVASAVLGYFDVQELIAGLGTFEFGTVWTVVKFAIKKYVGWIGAALLIYHIASDCL